jgi:class 3 adenylate cyclase
MMSRRASGVIAGPACDNRAAPRPAARLERIMPDLPSGTVTFLFTDIEMNTERWGNVGDGSGYRLWHRAESCSLTQKFVNFSKIAQS